MGVSAPQVWLGCQMPWASNGKGGLWSDAGEPEFPAAEVGLPSLGGTGTVLLCARHCLRHRTFQLSQL